MKKITILGMLFLAFSCSNNFDNNSHDFALENSSSENYKNANTEDIPTSSVAAVENKRDTTRKFIRTAELKFRAKNVIKATYDIEDITTRHGGFVTFTNLTSYVESTNVTPISADSSLETTYYTVNNTMTLRVPNVKMDTTLKEMTRNIDFLDFRIIKAEDVALQILSHNLAQKRAEKSEKRLTVNANDKNKPTTVSTEVENLLSNKEAQADQAHLAKLELQDQINFSTINLSIYQRQTIKRVLIANDKNIDAFEPSFGTRIGEALAFGWSAVEEFIIFLVKIWELILLGVIIFVLYKKYGHYLKEEK